MNNIPIYPFIQLSNDIHKEYNKCTVDLKDIHVNQYGFHIAVTIINYIKNKYELNITNVYPSDGFHCHWCLNRNNPIDMWIEVVTNFEEYDFEEMEILGIDKFIKQYNPLNINTYYFIFIVLHELGHSYIYNYLYELYLELEISLEVLLNCENIFNSTIDIYIPPHEKNDFYMNYHIRPTEAYANMFAYNHFYEIITLLKDINIIE